MRASLLSGVLAGLVSITPANAQSGAPAQSPELAQAIGDYRQCLEATDGQLRSAQVTPERYQMAFDGACLSEQEAAFKLFRAQLMAIPHRGISYEDAEQITAGTMASAQTDDERLRKKFVSTYVLWFATADRPKAKAGR